MRLRDTDAAPPRGFRAIACGKRVSKQKKPPCTLLRQALFTRGGVTTGVGITSRSTGLDFELRLRRYQANTRLTAWSALAMDGAAASLPVIVRACERPRRPGNEKAGMGESERSLATCLKIGTRWMPRLPSCCGPTRFVPPAHILERQVEPVLRLVCELAKVLRRHGTRGSSRNRPRI